MAKPIFPEADYWWVSLTEDNEGRGFAGATILRADSPNQVQEKAAEVIAACGARQAHIKALPKADPRTTEELKAWGEGKLVTPKALAASSLAYTRPREKRGTDHLEPWWLHQPFRLAH